MNEEQNSQDAQNTDGAEPFTPQELSVLETPSVDFVNRFRKRCGANLSDEAEVQAMAIALRKSIALTLKENKKPIGDPDKYPVPLEMTEDLQTTLQEKFPKSVTPELARRRLKSRFQYEDDELRKLFPDDQQLMEFYYKSHNELAAADYMDQDSDEDLDVDDYELPTDYASEITQAERAKIEQEIVKPVDGEPVSYEDMLAAMEGVDFEDFDDNELT